MSNAVGSEGAQEGGFYAPDVKELGFGVCYVLGREGGQLSAQRLAEVLGDFLKIPESARSQPHAYHPSHTRWTYHLAWVCTSLRKKGFMAHNAPETRGMCILTEHGHELGRWAAQFYGGEDPELPRWVAMFLQPIIKRTKLFLSGGKRRKPPDYELCRWVRYCYLLNRADLGVPVFNRILSDHVDPSSYRQAETQARILKLRSQQQENRELVGSDDH
jgi:hypothetical protein